ncbi:MAG: DNA methyltransferase, partial [Ktedonobacteraceae bacterium]
MPDGYYSGDQPNSRLRDFVEAHLAQHPYDPEDDTYNVPAFTKPIETTKATAIYNMHTYWSKKPHDAIRQYIHHYTQPGDLVLDSFCGSGGTALAALMEGCAAIAIDRSPAATFITKNYCTPVDTIALRRAFEELKKQVQPEIDWLYATRCERCGGPATTAYTVYSQVFECPRCLNRVPLFDCPVEKIQDTQGKQKEITVCPHCQQQGNIEEISTRAKRFGAVPVLVNYHCRGKCKPARSERRHNDEDAKKREYFEKYDLAKIREIEAKEIPHWYPTQKMMNVADDTKPWGVKWRAGTSNFRTVDELFTKRNLWALAAILEECKASKAADALLCVFQGNILNGTKMQRYREGGGGFANGTYYLPQLSLEREQLGCFARKFEDITSAQIEIQKGVKITEIIISTQSSTGLPNVPSNSIEYIFTDPPYADKVQYGELNFVWEAWLNFDTNWHQDEIIVNSIRGKGEEEWTAMMKHAMAECYRVLKPGRWLSLCYHDTAEGTWAQIQDMMAEVGFVADASDSVLYIDATQKSYNQLTADKITKRDLVINFRK